MTGASQPLIHPTALIDPTARLASDVEVGPYTCIGPRVDIGAGCKIASHVVIDSDTLLGERNNIWHHAVLGSDSQDLKFKGGTAGLVIGHDNVFREFVTINRATSENTATLVGDHNLLLAYSHVAHNCVLGDHLILSNATQLAGEVVLEDYVTTGGLVGIHQFCRVGAHAFIGACSKVTQDILPYLTADGHPARPHGLNLVGLRRRGFSEETITVLKHAYHRLFLKGYQLDEALDALQNDEEFASVEGIPRMLNFARISSRGVSRPRGHLVEMEDELFERISPPLAP